MSTKAQRLLSEATPLPWWVDYFRPESDDRYIIWAGPDEKLIPDGYGVQGDYWLNRTDAELIVHAVNTLPLYEELREAAGMVVDMPATVDDFDKVPIRVRTQIDEIRQEVRAILHRLEEEER